MRVKFTISPQSWYNSCVGNAIKESEGAVARSHVGGCNLAAFAGARHPCTEQRGSLNKALRIFASLCAMRGQDNALPLKGTGWSTPLTIDNQSSHSQLKIAKI